MLNGITMGIRAVAPRGKLPAGSGWGWVKVRVGFRVGGATRQLRPRKSIPRLGLGFGLGLVLGLGGNFPRG